jgi:ribosomal protein L7/L12
MDPDDIVDVSLTRPGPWPNEVANLIFKYRVNELNLKELTALVNAPPQVVLHDMTRRQASAIVCQLEALGAILEIQAKA